MKNNNHRKGFTIVEVALVLALAGLIFLMVFVALPAIQKTQRDAKRRDDVGELLTSIQKYQNNNRGSLPSGNGLITWDNAKNSESGETSWAGLYKSYLGEGFIDPTGNSNYVLNVIDCEATGSGTKCSSINVDNLTFPNNYEMYIVRSALCDGSTPVSSNNPRRVAVVYTTERAGAYCSNI